MRTRGLLQLSQELINFEITMESERQHFEDKEAGEVVTSRIELNFFRHGAKEKSIDGQPDEEVNLTPAGREQAVAEAEDEDISQSVASGSPRKRAQHTAGLVMAGKHETITGDESLEEFTQKVDAELEKLNRGHGLEGKHGSKMRVDKRLDFVITDSTELGKQLIDSFYRKEYLKFLVEQSDVLAESLHDTESETYSRQAGRIAEMVKVYLNGATRWDQLVRDESKNYQDTLKRFFSSHQGVVESFLAKVVDLTKGREERDKLVTALDNQGFGFVEGIRVSIETTSEGKQNIRVAFKKEKDGQVLFDYDEVVPEEVIEKLILEK
jgi:hypothetical protein